MARRSRRRNPTSAKPANWSEMTRQQRSAWNKADFAASRGSRSSTPARSVRPATSKAKAGPRGSGSQHPLYLKAVRSAEKHGADSEDVDAALDYAGRIYEQWLALQDIEGGEGDEEITDTLDNASRHIGLSLSELKTLLASRRSRR